MEYLSNEEIIQRLEYYMSARNITKTKLSKVAGLSHSTVNNIFVRRSAPSLKTFQVLLKALGLSEGDFFEGGASRDEIEVLNTYRNLSQSDREIFLKILRGLKNL